MSYILEALEKSDKERQLHHGLSRPSVREERIVSPSRRPFWFALLSIALLINAGILGWWIRPWKEKEPQPVLSSPAGEGISALKSSPRDNRLQQPIPGLSQPYDLVSRPANTDEKTKLPLPAVRDIGKVASGYPSFPADQGEKEGLSNLSAPGRPDPSIGKPLPQPVVNEEEPQGLPDEAPTTGSADTTKEEEPDESPAPLPVEAVHPTSAEPLGSDSVDYPTPATPAKTPVSRSPGAAAVPDIEKLPASVREKLPPLAISFHFYSHDPGSRMVSINGHLLREGQAMNEDLKVEEIIADGVIMNFQGERFRKGIFAQGQNN